ncbi:hypothetical protein PR048_007553 [Dryococelus australis]|uniref:Uncharacterized protein n=1 Tax=Dryococelus australis TaxID=614101 RepID=A0ABQ9HUZ8_9NEOP|nr:hypothetical protein PR048_007553 [Dryococelus australis]
MVQRRKARARKRDIPEKTRRPAASSRTIPTCKDPGIEPRMLRIARLLTPLHTGASALCLLAVAPHLAVMGFARCFLASLLLAQRRCRAGLINCDPIAKENPSFCIFVWKCHGRSSIALENNLHKHQGRKGKCRGQRAASKGGGEREHWLTNRDQQNSQTARQNARAKVNKSAPRPEKVFTDSRLFREALVIPRLGEVYFLRAFCLSRVLAARAGAIPRKLLSAVAERLVCSPPTRGESRSIPHRVPPGFPQAGIVPDDAAGQRVFSRISRFSPPSHSGAASYLRMPLNFRCTPRQNGVTSQQDVETPFANQRMGTCLPDSSPVGRVRLGGTR